MLGKFLDGELVPPGDKLVPHDSNLVPPVDDGVPLYDGNDGVGVPLLTPGESTLPTPRCTVPKSSPKLKQKSTPHHPNPPPLVPRGLPCLLQKSR